MESNGTASTKVEVERTESGILYWRDRSFWQLDITPNHETTGADAARFGTAIRTISKETKLPLLIYRARGSIPSFDALTQFAKLAPVILSAVAYWVVTKEAAATAKLVREVFLPGLPVEVFSTEQDAVAWINERLARLAAVREL